MGPTKNNSYGRSESGLSSDAFLRRWGAPSSSFRSGPTQGRREFVVVCLAGAAGGGPDHGKAGAPFGRLAPPPAAASGLHHSAGDGQAEAAAASVVGEAVEALEDPLPLAGRNTRTAVLNAQRHLAVFALHGNPDGAAFGCIAAGVVDQHSEQAVDPFRRRQHQPLPAGLVLGREPAPP